MDKLTKAGWIVMKKRGKGSHAMLYHPDRPQLVVVPKGEIKIGTLKSIEKASGVAMK